MDRPDSLGQPVRKTGPETAKPTLSLVPGNLATCGSVLVPSLGTLADTVSEGDSVSDSDS